MHDRAVKAIEASVTRFDARQAKIRL